MKPLASIWFVVGVGIIVTLGLMVAAVFMAGPVTDVDAASLCLFRGGVPITDANGRLTRCDFPVNLRGGW